MQTAQAGDRVQVHYVKRLQDGSTASSRRGAPLEVIVGEGHPRLPGLGLALVGLSPGASTTVRVSAENAYGPADAARVRRWARTRFPKDRPLPVGKWVPVLDRQGRPRSVRILEVCGKMVVVDTNHRWAGQSLELEVELISIECAATGARAGTGPGQHTDHLNRLKGPDEWQDDGGEG
jgi:peptidylprolyl isomerase